MSSSSNKSDEKIRIGFVPLVDFAPIAYAQETGAFERNGLNVELVREPGWATIRDKVAYGELDAVHAPVGLAFALNWGIGVLQTSCLTGYLINSNGDAVVVSRDLHELGAADVSSLASVIKSTRRSRPYTFAVPHQFSTHHFLLLHWLRPQGIQKERDIRIVVLPPSLMADCLAAGDIDGYCVGEPFNTVSVRRGTGVILEESANIFPLHPEKALIVTQDFHDGNEEKHLTLIRTIAESAARCETPEGRAEVVMILSEPHYLGMEGSLIHSSLFAGEQSKIGEVTSDTFHVFSHPDVNRPDEAKANWLISEMRLAGLLDNGASRFRTTIQRILREDIYDLALGMLKTP